MILKHNHGFFRISLELFQITFYHDCKSLSNLNQKRRSKDEMPSKNYTTKTEFDAIKKLFESIKKPLKLPGKNEILQYQKIIQRHQQSTKISKNHDGIQVILFVNKM